MLKIDLHMHTCNSKCGQHTLLEILEMACSKHMELVAITDHGPALKGVTRGVFFRSDRTPCEYKGMKLLKGMEANILDSTGKTDIPPNILPNLDVALVGLHPIYANAGAEQNTEALINLFNAGPAVDIVTHPDIATYPNDLERLVPAAAEKGVALELNASNIFLGKSDLGQTRKIIDLGKKHDLLFALNSDSHTWAEIARDEPMRDFIKELAPGPLNIINDWPVEKVIEHFEGRKALRA